MEKSSGKKSSLLRPSCPILRSGLGTRKTHMREYLSVPEKNVSEWKHAVQWTVFAQCRHSFGYYSISTIGQQPRNFSPKKLLPEFLNFEWKHCVSGDVQFRITFVDVIPVLTGSDLEITEIRNHNFWHSFFLGVTKPETCNQTFRNNWVGKAYCV